MLSAQLPQVRKLAVSLRMLLGGHLLVIGPQPIVVGFEKAADHGFTDALLAQLFLNVAQPTVKPLSATHRVTGRMRQHDVQQLGL